MNIHLPAILGFTRYQGFDPTPPDAAPDHLAIGELVLELVILA